ncbi:MAG TPA: HD-GYP domain-containing protein [Candidatus Dormibacteraeota bacterium]|jgi:putative nucleotidyltransferase with HDIG domain
MFAATAGRLGARPDWWLAGSLCLAGILALQFPVYFSLSQKVSVASAVFFAAALAVPVWQAGAVAASSLAIASALSVYRKVRSTRERPPIGAVLSILFNAGQGYLGVVAAGLVLMEAGVSATTGVARPGDAVAIVVAAAVMYAMNLLLLSVAAALATSRNPFSILRTTHRVVSLQSASLYALGATAAFASARFWWVPVLGVLPAVLAYFSMRNRVELRREAVRAMESMAEEVDSRDPYTYQHSRRVAAYARAICRQLRFSAAEIELVELAAKVHDVGKIRIPDSILLKPGRLTPDERRVMETHPRLGFEILSQFSEFAKVLDLVLTHHERYDGRGYPNRQVGRTLLLIAQVIPVADSLDAMTSGRAYRDARSWDWALDELRRGAGTQWNPKVVMAAVAALQHERGEPGSEPAASMPATATA